MDTYRKNIEQTETSSLPAKVRLLRHEVDILGREYIPFHSCSRSLFHPPFHYLQVTTQGSTSQGTTTNDSDTSIPQLEHKTSKTKLSELEDIPEPPDTSIPPTTLPPALATLPLPPTTLPLPPTPLPDHTRPGKRRSHSTSSHVTTTRKDKEFQSPLPRKRVVSTAMQTSPLVRLKSVTSCLQVDSNKIEAPSAVPSQQVVIITAAFNHVYYCRHAKQFRRTKTGNQKP